MIAVQTPRHHNLHGGGQRTRHGWGAKRRRAVNPATLVISIHGWAMNQHNVAESAKKKAHDARVGGQKEEGR